MPAQMFNKLREAEAFDGNQIVREEETKEGKCTGETVLVSYGGVTGSSRNSDPFLSK